MRVLLVQLPIPKSNFGLKTGNIPFGAACLKQAVSDIPGIRVEILDPHIASRGSDAFIFSEILRFSPDIIGFTLFCWNRERSLYLAERAKDRLGARIMVGGPEVCPDTPDLNQDYIDVKITGQGEQAFRQALIRHLGGDHPADGNGQTPASGRIFEQAPSPYLDGHLLPLPGDPMLLETQRGCPFGCRFCNYNKSMGKLVFKDLDRVCRAFAWARENSIEEVFLLDPTFNARPDLAVLLDRIRTLNPDPKIALSSEIRAEGIDPDLAALFRDAGFTEFEIGLQSIHPDVQARMGRKTNLNAFLSGVQALRSRGIRTKVDLIAGLPGDTLDGFLSSLEFVISEGLAEDIQVFPLLVLPGTYFRHHAGRLGLVYDPYPPYTLVRTPGFSQEDMAEAFEAAEARLDLALVPVPYLDIGFRHTNGGGDFRVGISGERLISKLILNRVRQDHTLETLAEELTSPYQIFIVGGDPHIHARAVTILSAANPYTPFEIVFIQPEIKPDTRVFLDAAGLKRPHFLDKDLNLLHTEPGNRAVLFTLVSNLAETVFQGQMERQAFLWTKDCLPEAPEINALSHLDGILIDSPVSEACCREWQDRFQGTADDLPQISFAGIELQNRWKALTGDGDWELSPDTAQPAGQDF